MRQTSFKSERVADLIDKITEVTGESRVEAVTHALEQRLVLLKRRNRAKRTLDWLEAAVWSQLGANDGKAPSKSDQEEMLGF